MGLNLTTRADYKIYAGIKSTNYDAEIDALIPRVSDFVKRYCNRTFVDHFITAKTEIFDGGTSHFILSEPPVNAVTSVSYSQDYGQTWTLLTQYVDWIKRDDTVLNLIGSKFPVYLQGYKVIYTAGYDDTPQDLEIGIMDLITYYRKNDMSVHSNSAPGTNKTQIEYITSSQLPAHIRRVLDQYRTDYT
jgi:hypothetical protein